MDRPSEAGRMNAERYSTQVVYKDNRTIVNIYIYIYRLLQEK